MYYSSTILEKDYKAIKKQIKIKKTTELKEIKKLRKTFSWETAKGDIILLKGMTTPHIQNTIICLYKKQEECIKYELGEFEINNMTAGEWIEIFRDELLYRNCGVR